MCYRITAIVASHDSRLPRATRITGDRQHTHSASPSLRRRQQGRAATTAAHQPGQTMTSDQPDLTRLDDPAFFQELARVRELLEDLPEQSADRDRLTVLREAMNREFDRRARAAWTRAS